MGENSYTGASHTVVEHRTPYKDSRRSTNLQLENNFNSENS